MLNTYLIVGIKLLRHNYATDFGKLTEMSHLAYSILLPQPRNSHTRTLSMYCRIIRLR